MKLKRNTADLVMDILAAALLLGTAIYLAVSWKALPDRIPTHYAFSGQPDRWGGRTDLLIPAAFSWVLFAVVTVVQCFPRLWNTGVTVTEENRERVYSVLSHTLASTKLLITAFFSALTVCGAAFRANIPIWFALIWLVLTAGDLIFWLIRLSKAK